MIIHTHVCPDCGIEWPCARDEEHKDETCAKCEAKKRARFRLVN